MASPLIEEQIGIGHSEKPTSKSHASVPCVPHSLHAIGGVPSFSLSIRHGFPFPLGVSVLFTCVSFPTPFQAFPLLTELLNVLLQQTCQNGARGARLNVNGPDDPLYSARMRRDQLPLQSALTKRAINSLPPRAKLDGAGPRTDRPGPAPRRVLCFADCGAARQISLSARIRIRIFARCRSP
jgi:hypothetical protein